MLATAAGLGLAGLSARIASASPRAELVLGVIDIDRPGSHETFARFTRALNERRLVDRFGVRPVFIAADQSSEAELVDLPNRVRAAGASMVVATSMATAKAVRRLGIPALFFAPDDPVAHGIVDSLQRPGGLMTGYASRPPSIAKMLELLIDAAPAVRRVAVLTEGAPSRDKKQDSESMLDGAARSGLSAEMFIVEERETFDQFMASERSRFDALVIPNARLPFLFPDHVVSQVRRRRVVAVFGSASIVRRGGLMAMYPDFRDSPDVLARQLEAILSGSRPGDIPVERSRVFGISVNLSASREMGLRFPSALVKRANVVVS